MNHEARNIEVTFIENDMSDAAVNQSFKNKQSLYGITREQFEALAESQGNCCASCGVDATGMVQLLNIDHDHVTNEIRGLLCSSCNTAAHWLDDDPEKAYKLAAYLLTDNTGLFVTGMSTKVLQK